MKAFVITLEGHAYSEQVAARCIRTGAEIGGITIERFPATNAEAAQQEMRRHSLHWTWDGRCRFTGLQQPPYGGGDARIGCAMSHFRLWKHCVELNEPILILEHDAVFIRAFPDFQFMGLCQINDPAGATKRGQWWSETMTKRGAHGVHPKTKVLPDDVPDGLAGNSAYIVKPFAARELIKAYRELGVWPNDATMCRQLFPYLEEYFPFVTRVEQTMSTTAG